MGLIGILWNLIGDLMGFIVIDWDLMNINGIYRDFVGIYRDLLRFMIVI